MCRKLNFLISFVLVLSLAGNVANADISDGLLVWHDFEDLLDNSGNGHDAVLSGQAYISDGLLYLDGTEDYADIGTTAGFGPINPLVDALSDFTIAVAYACTSTTTGEGGSMLVSIGPAAASASGDLSLHTNNDGQEIDHWYTGAFESSQSGVGYADGTAHLAIVTYEEATDTYTYYHLDGGAAVAHGSGGGLDWNGEWDGNLDYGIRLGSHRNSTIRAEEGPGFIPDLDGQIDMFAIWNRALATSEMPEIAEYIPGPAEKAAKPSPKDGATDLPRKVVLSWKPGEFADKHDVYFGTNFDDVNEATTTVDPNKVYQGRQDLNNYPISGTLDLDFGKTYYWRIDEVNAPPDYTIYRGDVWQFMIEPFAYPILSENITATASSVYGEDTGPENTVNGSGLSNDKHSRYWAHMWLSATGGGGGAGNPSPSGSVGAAWIAYEFDRIYKLYQMWIWNYNAFTNEDRGVRNVTIEYSTDGTNWTTLSTTHVFAMATGGSNYVHNTEVDFNGAIAKYVVITASETDGNYGSSYYGLSEVRLLYIPVLAKEPNPPSGATGVSSDVVLSWQAGREAASHNVYLSTDEQAVRDGNAPVSTVTEANYGPSSLDLDKTYYWKVNEVNDAQTPATWEGDIWSFSTQEFLVVEDFESYNDIPVGEEGSNLIYSTWTDGFDNPSANGSTIGYVEPFQPTMETDIVHGGRQSVPLTYDNSVAGLSEVTVNAADLTVGRDWTRADIKALTLYIHGSADNLGGQLYVKVNGAKQTQSADLAGEFWQEVNIDLASFGVNLQSVASLTIGIEGAGSSGLVYIDDIRLYPSRCLPEKVLGDLTGDCVVDADDLAVIADNWLMRPLLVEYMFDPGLSDASGNDRHGVGQNGPSVHDGILTLNGTNFVDIPLGADNPFDGSRDFSIVMDFRSKLPSILISSARDAEPDNHSMSVFVHHWDEPFGGQVIYDNYFVGDTTAEDDPLDGNWHTMVVTYDADGGWSDELEQPIGWATVYLDGVPGAGTDIDPNIPNIVADTVRIGSSLNTVFPYEEGVGNFSGDIDNVRIFNFALTNEDVFRLPTSLPTAPADLNGDGIVDQADQDIVEANMGPEKLWP